MIDTVTNVVAATIPVGDFPDGVAVAPTGGTVYVANAVDGTVSVIDTATKTVTFVIPGVGPHPSAIAIGASATSSAVTVTAEPNPAQVHHLVSLTATVTCSEGTPAGRVEFRDGATVLGSAGLRNGTATLVRHCEASTSPPVTVTVR